MKPPSIATAAAAASAIFLLAACSTPKLLRHYQTMQYKDPPPLDLQLSIFPANPKSGDDEPLIAGLSERAQAELIRSLAAKSSASGPDELLSLVHKSPEVPSKGCAWAVKKSVTKRVNLAVLGNLRKPADRIDKLDITLTLPQGEKNANGTRQAPRATFASWDRFDSVYGSFNIGSAKFTQSSKVSVGRTSTNTSNLADSAGSVVKVLDFGAEADRSLEESAAYALRRLSVGGALTPAVAKLVQEGGPNINLFGSSAATLTLDLTTNEDPGGIYAFVLTKQGKALTPSEVQVERCDDIFPISNVPILAGAQGNALLREVISGDGTVPEGDDEAQMTWTGLTALSATVELASRKDLTIERYALGQCRRMDKEEKCDFLHLERNGAGASIEQVLHPSMDAALELRAWLVTQAKTHKVSAVGGKAVGIASSGAAVNGMPAEKLTGLTHDQASRLRVIFYADNRPPRR
jgi:hypothetical protein